MNKQETKQALEKLTLFHRWIVTAAVSALLVYDRVRNLLHRTV